MTIFTIGHSTHSASATPHRLTQFAKVEGVRVTYPGAR
jgi:hypothetical protein